MSEHQFTQFAQAVTDVRGTALESSHERGGEALMQESRAIQPISFQTYDRPPGNEPASALGSVSARDAHVSFPGGLLGAATRRAADTTGTSATAKTPRANASRRRRERIAKGTGIAGQCMNLFFSENELLREDDGLREAHSEYLDRMCGAAEFYQEAPIAWTPTRKGIFYDIPRAPCADRFRSKGGFCPNREEDVYRFEFELEGHKADMQRQHNMDSIDHDNENMVAAAHAAFIVGARSVLVDERKFDLGLVDIGWSVPEEYRRWDLRHNRYKLEHKYENRLDEWFLEYNYMPQKVNRSAWTEIIEGDDKAKIYLCDLVTADLLSFNWPNNKLRFFATTPALFERLYGIPFDVEYHTPETIKFRSLRYETSRFPDCSRTAFLDSSFVGIPFAVLLNGDVAFKHNKGLVVMTPASALTCSVPEYGDAVVEDVRHQFQEVLKAMMFSCGYEDGSRECTVFDRYYVETEDDRNHIIESADLFTTHFEKIHEYYQSRKYPNIFIEMMDMPVFRTLWPYYSDLCFGMGSAWREDDAMVVASCLPVAFAKGNKDEFDRMIDMAREMISTSDVARLLNGLLHLILTGMPIVSWVNWTKSLVMGQFEAEGKTAFKSPLSKEDIRNFIKWAEKGEGEFRDVRSLIPSEASQKQIDDAIKNRPQIRRVFDYPEVEQYHQTRFPERNIRTSTPADIEPSTSVVSVANWPEEKEKPVLMLPTIIETAEENIEFGYEQEAIVPTSDVEIENSPPIVEPSDDGEDSFDAESFVTENILGCAFYTSVFVPVEDRHKRFDEVSHFVDYVWSDLVHKNRFDMLSLDDSGDTTEEDKPKKRLPASTDTQPPRTSRINFDSKVRKDNKTARHNKRAAIRRMVDKLEELSKKRDQLLGNIIHFEHRRDRGSFADFVFEARKYEASRIHSIRTNLITNPTDEGDMILVAMEPRDRSHYHRLKTRALGIHERFANIGIHFSPLSNWKRDLTKDGDVESNPGPITNVFKVLDDRPKTSAWLTSKSTHSTSLDGTFAKPLSVVEKQRAVDTGFRPSNARFFFDNINESQKVCYMYRDQNQANDATLVDRRILGSAYYHETVPHGTEYAPDIYRFFFSGEIGIAWPSEPFVEDFLPTAFFSSVMVTAIGDIRETPRCVPNANWATYWRFVEAMDMRDKLNSDGPTWFEDLDRKVILIGADNYAVPVPLAKAGDIKRFIDRGGKFRTTATQWARYQGAVLTPVEDYSPKIRPTAIQPLVLRPADQGERRDGTVFNIKPLQSDLDKPLNDVAFSNNSSITVTGADMASWKFFYREMSARQSIVWRGGPLLALKAAIWVHYLTTTKLNQNRLYRRFIVQSHFPWIKDVIDASRLGQAGCANRLCFNVPADSREHIPLDKPHRYPYQQKRQHTMSFTVAPEYADGTQVIGLLGSFTRTFSEEERCPAAAAIALITNPFPFVSVTLDGAFEETEDVTNAVQFGSMLNWLSLPGTHELAFWIPASDERPRQRNDLNASFDVVYGPSPTASSTPGQSIRIGGRDSEARADIINAGDYILSWFPQLNHRLIVAVIGWMHEVGMFSTSDMDAAVDMLPALMNRCATRFAANPHKYEVLPATNDAFHKNSPLWNYVTAYGTQCREFVCDKWFDGFPSSAEGHMDVGDYLTVLGNQLYLYQGVCIPLKVTKILPNNFRDIATDNFQLWTTRAWETYAVTFQIVTTFLGITEKMLGAWVDDDEEFRLQTALTAVVAEIFPRDTDLMQYKPHRVLTAIAEHALAVDIRGFGLKSNSWNFFRVVRPPLRDRYSGNAFEMRIAIVPSYLNTRRIWNVALGTMGDVEMHYNMTSTSLGLSPFCVPRTEQANAMYAYDKTRTNGTIRPNMVRAPVDGCFDDYNTFQENEELNDANYYRNRQIVIYGKQGSFKEMTLSGDPLPYEGDHSMGRGNVMGPMNWMATDDFLAPPKAGTFLSTLSFVWRDHRNVMTALWLGSVDKRTYIAAGPTQERIDFPMLLFAQYNGMVDSVHQCEPIGKTNRLLSSLMGNESGAAAEPENLNKDSDVSLVIAGEPSPTAPTGEPITMRTETREPETVEMVADAAERAVDNADAPLE